MRIIAVIDLRGGRAVHARGGRRELYAPVQQVAGVSIADGDATAVARAYTRHLGVEELYAADLDGITSGAPREDPVRQLAAVAPLWLDAGVSTVDRARCAAETGAARVVVALETLSSMAALAEICRAVGRDRVAFSLDLRDREPVVAAGSGLGTSGADRLAELAADAGATAVIAIDLARVGAGTGPDVEMMRRLRSAVPTSTLIAGGGVRGADDVCQLEEAGCDGVLVASALHDGRLTADDVAAAGRRQRIVSR
jgi:phosphoribosylformimino-5-aminoimidazole carboxamide ribotide isomerase